MIYDSTAIKKWVANPVAGIVEVVEDRETAEQAAIAYELHAIRMDYRDMFSISPEPFTMANDDTAWRVVVVDKTEPERGSAQGKRAPPAPGAPLAVRSRPGQGARLLADQDGKKQAMIAEPMTIAPVPHEHEFTVCGSCGKTADQIAREAKESRIAQLRAELAELENENDTGNQER